MPPLPSWRTIRYGPKRWPDEKRNGKSAGEPVAVAENDRVSASDDHAAARSVWNDGDPVSRSSPAAMGPPVWAMILHRSPLAARRSTAHRSPLAARRWLLIISQEWFE